MRVWSLKLKTLLLSSRFQLPVIILLLLLLLVPGVVYIWIVVLSTNENRADQVLDQQKSVAFTGARLLNAQVKSAQMQLSLLSEQDSLESALRQNQPAQIQTELQRSIKHVPEMLSLGIYDARGRLLAQCPMESGVPLDASKTEWYRRLSAGHALYTNLLPKASGAAADIRASLAIPLHTGQQKETRPTGYLLGYYRMDDMNAWVQLRDEKGVRVCLVDKSENIIYSTLEPAQASRIRNNHQIVQMALNSSFGSYQSASSGERDTDLFGYAYAETPGWGVLVLQPLDAAIGQNILLVRLFLVPIFLLMLTAAWIIVRLHYRQVYLAGQLTRQNRLLQETDQARADFLAHISHDLRTPLANMRLALASLEEPQANLEPDMVQESCRQIDEEIEQLTARIRNLLEMSRLEAHTWPMEKIPSDLTDIASSALERMRPALQGREISWDFPEEPLLIDCDPGQIEAVMINLLENAVKYTPPGSPLRLRGRFEDGHVWFEIEDSGPGIPAGEEALIFQKYYRASRDRSIQGTGLGLAICQAILSAHGSAMHVRPGAACGAIFWFTLPVMSMQEG